MRLVKLTHSDGNGPSPIWLNPLHVVELLPTVNNYTWVYCVGDDPDLHDRRVAEPPEEVARLINEALSRQ